jgi:hypothetical protein
MQFVFHILTSRIELREGSGIYKMNAARPAAAAIPANAVWRAPPADELEEPEPVAEEPAEEALEAREETDDLALETAELALLSMEESWDEATEASEEAELPAPLPKMVVEPRVVVKVDEPEVTTETMAEVVIAEEEPEPLPAPPTPKMVVEPTVVMNVEEPDVTVETIAEVVIAEEDDPPAPAPAPVEAYTMSANSIISRQYVSYTRASCGHSNGTSSGGNEGGSSGSCNTSFSEVSFVQVNRRIVAYHHCQSQCQSQRQWQNQ